jgi:hypothetical protein
MHLTLGNHEDRINRAANDSPELLGTLSVSDLDYEKYGWKVSKYRETITLDGVVYCHYLAGGVMGKPIATPAAMLTKKHQSAVVGHQQGYQIATAVRADGKMLTGIIAGSAYLHDEDYLGPQGNKHWRGFLILHDVTDGEFSTQQVSMKHLNAKFPFNGQARKVSRRLLGKPIVGESLVEGEVKLSGPKNVDWAKVIAKGLAK